MRQHIFSAVLLAIMSLLAVGSVDDHQSASGTSSGAHSPQPNDDKAMANDVRTTAAALFTSRYASSQWSSLGIHARAAGADCGVLLVTIGTEMDDSSIEAIHYGQMYSVYDGGVEHFYHERTFRGVVYRDVTARYWRYGLVSREEAKQLPPC